MKGLTGMRLGLVGAAAALALIGGLFLAAQVSAVSGDLSISSATAAPGADASVELRSDVGSPGLGAWTVDIAYDPAVVSVADCDPEEGGVCNPDFGADTVRVAGANATGLEGDTLLGTITFTCGDAEDTSALTISIDVFADATIGDPQPIDETVTNGSIECAVPPPTPTPLPEIAGVGQGSGSSGGSDTLGWLLAGLAGAGALTLAGYGALRLRARAS